MDPPIRFPTPGQPSSQQQQQQQQGETATSSTLIASDSGNNFDDGGDDFGGGIDDDAMDHDGPGPRRPQQRQAQPPPPPSSQQQQRRLATQQSSLSKSPMSSQQSNRASISSTQQPPRPSSQQQQPPPFGRGSSAGGGATTKPSPHHHVSRQQMYEFEQQRQQQQNDDDDDIDEEGEDDEEDESYPLSMPTHPNYQQARLQQQQQKAMMRKPDIGFKSPNSTMVGGGPSPVGLMRQTSANASGPPYQSALKPNVHTVHKPATMGHYASGYEMNSKDGKIDLWGHLLVGLSYFFLIVSFPFSLCACVKVAQEYERAVIFRLGRILAGGAKGPGIFFVLPCIDTYTKVDLRTVTFDVPPQEILTKDSVTVSVDAVVYFRIFNAVISVINVEDAAKSTKLLAASTLRNILGTKSLHEILSDRESVAILIQNNLDEATGPWGVKVERVEVKDVRLPVQLQRAMATEAEAAREARAKVIAAEGEQKASKALKEAAEVISESPIAIQLRYLQTLTQIASEKNSTIVFPIPLEMLSFLANKTAGIFKIKN